MKIPFRHVEEDAVVVPHSPPVSCTPLVSRKQASKQAHAPPNPRIPNSHSEEEERDPIQCLLPPVPRCGRGSSHGCAAGSSARSWRYLSWVCRTPGRPVSSTPSPGRRCIDIRCRRWGLPCGKSKSAGWRSNAGTWAVKYVSCFVCGRLWSPVVVAVVVGIGTTHSLSFLLSSPLLSSPLLSASVPANVGAV